jgi:hypothetical protein
VVLWPERRVTVRKILLAALAAGLMTSTATAEPLTWAAVAEPRPMTEVELKRATAGADLVDIGVIVPVNVAANVAIAAALAVLAENTMAGAGADTGIIDAVSLNQGFLGLVGP